MFWECYGTPRTQALTGNRHAEKQNQLRLKTQLLAAQLRSEKELTRALARACADLAAETRALALRQELEEECLSCKLRLEKMEQQMRGRRNVGLLHPK